ncbi:MAG: glycosyltransferase family 39 protein [Planctomycetaceae bacterium]
MTAPCDAVVSENRPGRLLAKWSGELTIGVVAGVSFLAVWPLGEYAILDDWAFVKSLQHLHERGELVVLDWNPMSLTGHLLWGLLFTKCLGFSFFVTKLSAFVAGVILVLIVYWMCRRMHVSVGLSLTAALGLWLNPLFLPHCFMYMTDVTSLLWQWLSVVCLLQGLSGENRRARTFLVAGSGLWALAFLTRQHGIVVPLAFVAWLFLFHRARFWSHVPLYACLPGAWLAMNGLLWHRMNQAFNTSSDLVWEFLSDPPWSELPYIFFSYAVYIGLFALPVMASVRWSDLRRLSGRRMALVAAAIWLGVFLFVQYSMRGLSFPYIRNVVTNWGLFQPHEFVVGDRLRLWDPGWGITVGASGIVAALSLLAAVLAVRSSSETTSTPSGSVPSPPWMPFLLLLFVAQIGYVMATSPILYDRHLLLLAPTVLILAASHVRRCRPMAAVALLIGYGAYGIVGTHDIHAVSRVVFLEGERLLASGIPSRHVDAGYAFDGWHMYEESQAVQPAPAIRLPPWWPSDRKTASTDLRQPWWIYHLVTTIQPDYVVGVSAGLPSRMFPGADPFQRQPAKTSFRTFWPWRRQSVFVFQRHSTPERPSP